MKKELKAKFKTLYAKECRLLAIQLNGFSHSVVYDKGKNTEINFDRFSHCMPEDNWSNSAREFFKDIPNFIYQNNPDEIVYIMPKERA